VNRADLQQLAETRLREAKVLLDAGEWSGSYYLCGYSVECALDLGKTFHPDSSVRARM
jgi:hypothetical protein